MNKNNKKKGFTLAETLITLLVLGIVFAIVLPIVLTTLPNRRTLNWQKAYSATTEAIRKLSSNENLFPEFYECAPRTATFTDTTGGCYQSTVEGKYALCKNDLDQEVTQKCSEDNAKCKCSVVNDCCIDKVPSGFKGIEYGNATGSDSGEKFCKEFAKLFNVKGDVDCAKDDTKPLKKNFTTVDGISFMGLHQNFKDKDYITICIDTVQDGDDNTDMGCTSNYNDKEKDQFRLQIGYRGDVEIGFTGSKMYDNNGEKLLTSGNRYTYDKSTCDPNENKVGSNSASNYCIEYWALQNVHANN